MKVVSMQVHHTTKRTEPLFTYRL